MEVILSGMTHRVGPKGQVVIPKALRDQLDLRPGDEVVFWQEGDHIAVRRAALTPPLRGRFRGRPLVATLEDERARDEAREGAR
jgi:AbrB family looped-hinge helix DNA binding protein